MSDTKTSVIKLTVELDEAHVPETILWEADDSGQDAPQRVKAMLLALWDGEARNTLRIDLWTKDMPVDEMNLMFYQTLHSLADTYGRATADKAIMADMKIFAEEFGEKAQRAMERAHQQARQERGG